MYIYIYCVYTFILNDLMGLTLDPLTSDEPICTYISFSVCVSISENREMHYICIYIYIYIYCFRVFFSSQWTLRCQRDRPAHVR